MTHEHGIGTRTLRGMFWAYGSYVGGRLLVLVSMAVLARLLVPSDFGLVALALVFIAFLETLSDLGLTQALVIADDSEVARRVDSVWASSVLIGVALLIVIAALGPVAAAFFHEPRLVALMAVLGLNQFLRSLGTTHYALAQRKLNFRARSFAELADVVVRGGVGIALAVAGAGAWSLVLGYVVGTLTLTVALWLLVDWRPRLRLRRADLSGMIAFGGALTAINVLAAIMGSADDLIVGRVLGTTQLGFYSLAFRLPELLILNLSLVAGQVLFPAMATIDREALPWAFLRALRYALMIGLPLAVGLLVLAEPLVLAAFGEQWRAAAPAMRVMALWTLMSPIGIIIGTAYKALGRTDILLKLAIAQVVVLIPAVLLVADRGIVAVAACQAVVAIVFTSVAMVLALRVLGLTARGISDAIWPASAAAAGLGGALLVLTTTTALGPWPTLVAGAGVGALAYGGLLWLVAREDLRALMATAFPNRVAPAHGGKLDP